MKVDDTKDIIPTRDEYQLRWLTRCVKHEDVGMTLNAIEAAWGTPTSVTILPVSGEQALIIWRN